VGTAQNNLTPGVRVPLNPVLVLALRAPGVGVDFFSIESPFSFMWAPRKTIRPLVLHDLPAAKTVDDVEALLPWNLNMQALTS